MKPVVLSRANRVWLIVALIGLVAGGLLYLRAAKKPAVPEINFAGEIDPVVQQTVESARKAVNKNPESDREWGVLGMVLAAHQAFGPASQCFAKAERLNPDEPRWPYFLAMTSGDNERTIAALERAAAVGGPEPLPRLLLGERLLAIGQTSAAEQHFQSVLDADPTEPRALTGMASIAFSEGNMEAAHTALLDAAARSPQVRERLQLLAQVLNRLGRRELAITVQRQAEAAVDSWPDPYYLELLPYEVGSAELGRRIDGYAYAGMRNEALAVAARAIELHPDNVTLHIQYGRLVSQLGRHAEAEATFRRVLELRVDDGEAYFMLGYSLWGQHRFGDAESALRDALEREPDNVAANLLLGITLDETGDKSGAADSYQLVLELDPGNKEALKRLNALRASLSRTPQ